MEAEGGNYVILILFQAAEMWLDMNLLEMYEKETKIFFQVAFLSRPVCCPKTDEKINKKEKE